MVNIIVFRKFFFLPSETFIYHQVSFLKKHFHIYLVANGFSGEQDHDFSGLKKVRLGRFERVVNRVLARLRRGIVPDKYSLYNPRQIKRLIRKQEIRVIHAQFGTEAIRILTVAKEARVPLIVSFHGYDASSSLRNEYYRSQLQFLLDYASKIIIVSKHMVDTLQLAKWADKVVLLPCGIDVDEFKALPKLDNSSNTTILHSGRLVAKKGVEDLIDVFSNLYRNRKDIQLRILGDGPELSSCQQKVNDLSLAGVVHFLGAQPHARVKEEMHDADIFVLNSRTDDAGDMEGTPVSILEAMSMGKAVVSTYHAGIPDVIRDGVNGRLVEERNSVALGAAINELVDDKEQRRVLGAAARQTVVDNYSTRILFPKLQQVIDEVANATNV